MCGVQGEHRVAFGPNNKSSENANEFAGRRTLQKSSRSRKNKCRRHPKRQEEAGRQSGSRQANQTGRRQGRPKKHTSSHQNRLTNIFSSSHQNRPEEQENFEQGHQNRPAIDRQPSSTFGKAHECASHPAKHKNKTKPSQHQPKRQNIILHLPTSKGANLPKQAKKMAKSQESKIAAGADEKSISKQGQKGKKAEGEKYASQKYTLQRVEVSMETWGWGSSEMTLPTSSNSN